VTGVIRGDKTQTDAQLLPIVRELQAAGIQMRGTGNTLDDIMQLGVELSRDMTPQGRERYRKYRAVIAAATAAQRK
jgi:hypothetical protein